MSTPSNQVRALAIAAIVEIGGCATIAPDGERICIRDAGHAPPCFDDGQLPPFTQLLLTMNHPTARAEVMAALGGLWGMEARAANKMYDYWIKLIGERAKAEQSSAS